MGLNYIALEKTIREQAAAAGNKALAALPYEDMLKIMHDIERSFLEKGIIK